MPRLSSGSLQRSKFRGDRLRTLRDLHGMKQEDLANRLHVTVTALSKWENGKNDPRPAIIPDILAAFPETTREYFFDTGELPKSDHAQSPLIGFSGSVFGEVEVILRGGWSFFHTSPRGPYDDEYSNLREGRLLFFLIKTNT
jgi:transcriptional regulator with XRE-family HTH domain